MRWIRRSEITESQVEQLAEQLDINKMLARVLLNRGLDFDRARIMVKDTHEAIIDPTLLTNAQEAADRITRFCSDKKNEIWVFADYDCDGITAGYVMTAALREVSKCSVYCYYPERHESYGLSMNFCKRLIESMTAPTMVITVDNGITKVEEVEYLKANGVEVIVTDHHVAKEQTPDCLIVDPHNNGESNTFKHLAGCGVAFKVAQLVQRNLNTYGMMKYTPAVAIGTIADIMPMSMENIAFVKYGLDLINSKQCPVGIKALMDYIGQKTITSYDIAWEIGPRINACGRMGDINLAAKIFFTDEIEIGADIEDVVVAIERLNIERKNHSDRAKKMLEKLNFDDDMVCIVDATGYPEGVIGIIANKATDMFGKPSIVVSLTEKGYVGSARSVGGINLQELLQAEIESGNIISFGGHETAAGLALNQDKLEDLRASLNKKIRESVCEIRITEVRDAELVIDGDITISNLSEDLYATLHQVPYDNRSFAQPVFALSAQVVKTKTSSNNPNNICFDIKDKTGTKSVWAWGMAEAYKAMGEPKLIQIAGSIERNFMNKKEMTLRVVDFLPCEVSP